MNSKLKDGRKNDYGVRVAEYRKMVNRGCCVKIKSDEGINDDETSKIHRRQSHLGASLLSNSKRIRIHFKKFRDGNNSERVCEMDTDSIWFGKNIGIN